MDLSSFEVGALIGVNTATGPNFYVKTEEGLDGPFLDRECTTRPHEPVMPRIRKNAKAGIIERHHDTGRRRRHKAITMSDLKEYKTDHQGTIHRVTPKALPKKARRRLKHGEVKPE